MGPHDVKRARRRKRLTQDALAQRAGVSLRTVSRFESGKPVRATSEIAILRVVTEGGTTFVPAWADRLLPIMVPGRCGFLVEEVAGRDGQRLWRAAANGFAICRDQYLRRLNGTCETDWGFLTAAEAIAAAVLNQANLDIPPSPDSREDIRKAAESRSELLLAYLTADGRLLTGDAASFSSRRDAIERRRNA